MKVSCRGDGVMWEGLGLEVKVWKVSIVCLQILLPGAAGGG